MHPSLIPENKIHKNQAKGMNKDLKKGRIPLKHRKVLNITTNPKINYQYRFIEEEQQSSGIRNNRILV
jgi:hypothetical protein